MEKITSLLTELAQKLGTTVEYLWPLLVKQTYIYCISTLIINIFFVISSVIGLIVVSKMKRPYFNGHGGPTLRLVITAVSSLILLISVTLLAIDGPSLISGAFVPEAEALKNLISQIR